MTYLWRQRKPRFWADVQGFGRGFEIHAEPADLWLSLADARFGILYRRRAG